MSARADRLERLLAERELDSLLVTNLVNVRYLTGFTGTNGACVVAQGKRIFITDFRYVERAKDEVPDFERRQGGRDLLADAAALLTGRAGFEDYSLSVAAHARVAEAVGDGVELARAGRLVEELRMVKEPAEVGAIREAARLADELFAGLLERGVAGRTEREVAVELEEAMRRRGAEPSFPSIVAAAENGALPHATPRDVEIPAGTLVIVDWGCVLDGYCSDCTRTLATGPIEDEASEVYELVLAAQRESLTAVRAGEVSRDVDSVARDRIAEAGHGDHFGHSLGHGVGLEIHEEPRLAQGSDRKLEAGNVVTVEPGVYLPGRFGVRIEDLVAVTDDGAEVLSSVGKELISV